MTKLSFGNHELRSLLCMCLLLGACSSGDDDTAGMPLGGSGSQLQPPAGAAMGGSGGQSIAPPAPPPVAGSTAASGGNGGTAIAAGAGGMGGMAGAAGTAGSAGMGGTSAGGAAGSMPSPAGACSGKAGMKHGRSDEMVMAAGVKRTFIYYVPAGIDPNAPVPLVIVPHGSTMSGKQMLEITGYDKLAEQEKFIAIFPDGVDGPGSVAPWNVGTGTCGLGAVVAGAGNDQAFVDELIKFADADTCIDHDHIFMTGFSMGGYFSHETGCLRPDIRAIGPHSGGTHDLSGCKVQHKPVIIFHFTSDSLIDYSCATDARDKWVAKNGCMPSDPDVRMVKGGKCEYYKGCPKDGQVALCSFEEPAGGAGEAPTGHAWSGGSQMGENPLAAIPSTESATELGWHFFKEFAW